MDSPAHSQYHLKIRAVLEGLLTFISFNGEQFFHEEQAKSSMSSTSQTSSTKNSSPPRHASLPSPGKSVSPTKAKMTSETAPVKRPLETSPTKRPSPPKRVTWTSNVVSELPADYSAPLVVPANFVPSSNCQKSILKPASPPRHPPVYRPPVNKTVKYVPPQESGIPKYSTWEELVAWSNSALACN
jgi:cytoskeletal protein RodZ